jgi:hypothetical protein
MKRSAFVWALLLCIVLVNGFMAAPSVGHAKHHADHHAGTHSTGICAWLCAAGQGVETTSVQPVSGLQLIERTFILPFEAVFSTVRFLYFFRGPPAFPF